MKRRRPKSMTNYTGKNTGLKAVRLLDVCLIPRRLVEQIKLRDWPVERFYMLSGPITAIGLVYGWVDKESLIRGFLWGNANPLDMHLHVHLLSVDREFQGKGIMADAVELCRRIVAENKLLGITAWTRAARAFTRLGFVPTGEQKCVMEIKT